MPLLQGCPDRAEVEAYFFKNAQICGTQPGCAESGIEDLCAKYPELWKFGIYRVLNDGKHEFLSYCDPRIREFQSIHDRDLNRVLDKYLPKPPVDSGQGG